MPIIKIENGKQTSYIGVRELEDGALADNATNKRHIVAECVDRGDVENELQLDYLDRLEQHARDCALLEHLVENPPEEDSASLLKTVSRLASRVTADAIDLRTYDPFVTLTADLDEPEKAHGWPLFVTETHRFAYDPGDPADVWRAARHSLRESSPSKRAWRTRDEERKRLQAAEAEAKLTPSERKAIRAFADAWNKPATGAASANKRARRAKRAKRKAK